jgi:hypothetical protein
MTPITEKGLITGPADLIEKLPAAAFRVKSWDNTHSPKTQAEAYRALGGDVRAESIFDARHGRRYMLFVYRTHEERKACWDHHTRPRQ